MSIPVGTKGRAEDVVREENSARAMGSGTLPVFATPAMTARLEITHDSASPLGMQVWAESEVTEVDRKRIVLKVAAYDQKGLIGQGVHERFIVTDDRFLSKAGQKLEG